MTVRQCPECGARHDDQTFLDESAKSPPNAGDVGICFDCGALFMMTDGVHCRKLTLDEHLELRARANWAVVSQAQRRIRARAGRS